MLEQRGSVWHLDELNWGIEDQMNMEFTKVCVCVCVLFVRADLSLFKNKTQIP